jgi:predicted acylesterase/phospholipase RssA
MTPARSEHQSNVNDSRSTKQRQVHLVLSGGGVKCLSYIGAVDALASSGVVFASVSGISAGSLLGAILCTEGGLERLKSVVYELDVSGLGTGRRWFSALRAPFSRFRKSRVDDIFRTIVGGDPTFDSLKLPFATFGVDFATGEIHVYSRDNTPTMRVSEALVISTAAPFLFPPVPCQEAILLDGAVVSMSPVWLATVHQDELPILVLRPERTPATKMPSSPIEYVAELISTAASSRDEYLIKELPRARLIEINCGYIKWDNLTLSEAEKQRLVLSGRKELELRLRDIDQLLSGTHKTETSRREPPAAQSAASEAMRSFAAELSQRRDQVFLSYSREDFKYMARLRDAMLPYTLNRAVKVWDDTHIQPGTKWRSEIEKALASAKVAVLLVSPAYLNSEFITHVELHNLLRAAEEHGLRILPVNVSPVDHFRATKLAEYQFIGSPERPWSEMSEDEFDRELVMVCEAIQRALESE